MNVSWQLSYIPIILTNKIKMEKAEYFFSLLVGVLIILFCIRKRSSETETETVTYQLKQKLKLFFFFLCI